MISPPWPAPRWTSSSAAPPWPALPPPGAARWRWRGGEAGEHAHADPVRDLLPLRRDLPEARPPEDEARRHLARHQLGGVPTRGGGAVDGAARPGGGEGRPGRAAEREPTGVGLRRPGHALRRR